MPSTSRECLRSPLRPPLRSRRSSCSGHCGDPLPGLGNLADHVVGQARQGLAGGLVGERAQQEDSRALGVIERARDQHRPAGLPRQRSRRR